LIIHMIVICGFYAWWETGNWKPETGNWKPPGFRKDGQFYKI